MSVHRLWCCVTRCWPRSCRRVSREPMMSVLSWCCSQFHDIVTRSAAVGDVDEAVVHLERPAVDDVEARRRVLAVVERVVVDPHARRRPHREVVVRRVPVAAGVVGIPLREAVVRVREREVAHDHVVGVADAQRCARDARVVADADERHVRADVLQRQLRLERGRGDPGLLERPGRVDARSEGGDVVVHGERRAGAGDGAPGRRCRRR